MKTAVQTISLAAIAIAILCVAGCKTPSQKAAAVELFNGKNLDGWTFCMRNDSDPAKTWSASDGVIHCTGQPYGYARTTQTYQNYKLTCIWRFVRVAPHADNSGIFVHIQQPDKVWPVCVECQGQYQHQGDIYLQPGFGADGYPAAKKATLIRQQGPSNENPAGEWGTNTIVCNGGNITLSVNGKVMNQLTGCTITSGYIGIQAEGGDIEVRKLTLEPLE
ncbi:MAG TPA: DUF1080 domain-containing protein [Verrucomicrobiae bacterium]|nr:DUF1080 domain-containing protein [Verrucomicrobiae bacterium]